MQTEKKTSKGNNFSMQEGGVEQVCPEKDQFVSNIFIVKKNDGGNRPDL